MDEPTVEGLFAAGPGGRKIAVTCYGHGQPVVVYDAGSDDSGISDMYTSPALHEVAEHTTTCSFDRLGRGRSDKPPNRRRTLDDLVAGIHSALSEAGLRKPFILVGSSWGGFDIYEHAGVYPGDVAALLMLDVPKGQANIQDVGTWEENDEHVDVAAAERQMALNRKPIPAIPVTVVTARFGQSEDKREQRVWLVGSSDPRQVMVDTGHDVIREDAGTVVTEVMRLIQMSSSG
jgi:pimeloyl-ACP methyl ester carboxylesterase